MKKPSLVILDSYQAVGTGLCMDWLNELADVKAIYDRTMPCDIISRIGEAEAILVNKTQITREIIEACPSLKYIGIFATGYNMVDLTACRERGICVSNVPGYSTKSVAQLAFTLMLDLLFLTAKHDNEVHNGEWKEKESFFYYDTRITELTGKTLGLVGFGSIGKQMARIALAFDVKVITYTRTRYPEWEDQSIEFVSLDDLLLRSDIVSLHVPLLKETESMIDANAIAKMKKNAYLINTARGGLLDEKAVADALNSGKLAGAGLDVLAIEPPTPTNPLLTAKNCIITPHIAWSTSESRARLLSVVKSNLSSFISGAPHNNVAQL